MKNIFALSLAFVVLSVSSLFADEDGFVSLFNGKNLEGWTSAHSKGKNDWGPFSVDEKEQAIHVYATAKDNEKTSSDCLNTNKDYSHFILKLEYKWLDRRFKPRQTHDRDAGLLFHVHGNLKKVWPLSLEMQIGESKGDKKHGKGDQGRFHTGDLFVLGRHLRTKTPRDGKEYSADGAQEKGRSVPTSLGVEKPKGEWNEMELRVHGSEKATFILNGDVVLETFDFTQEKSGEEKPLNKGRIGLQAEWAELMYRKIRIKELKPGDATAGSDKKMEKEEMKKEEMKKEEMKKEEMKKEEMKKEKADK